MPGLKKGKGNGKGCAPVTVVNEFGRVCTGKCGQFKTWNLFYRKENGHTSQCRECINENMIPRSLERNRNLKRAAMDAYGGFCQCCGESELAFLQIDHINDDGAEHRREMGGNGKGGNFYAWLKRHHYPPGFQVLCANCNVGKQVNGGTCPHTVITCILTMVNQLGVCGIPFLS